MYIYIYIYPYTNIYMAFVDVVKLGVSKLNEILHEN